MTTLSAALELHARGVSSIVKGDHSAALSYFRHALIHIRSMAQSDEESLSITSRHSFHIRDVACTPTESQSCFRMFDRCFAIVPGEDIAKRPVEVGLDLLTGTILYNMAFVCHRESICRKQEYSRKASRTYEMAARTLQRFETKREVLEILTAISNNLASLAMENFDFVSFEQHRNHMQALLRRSALSNFDFFSANLAAAFFVRDWPAPAA